MEVIIGMTGTFASGKGKVAEYLVENYGFSHFSVRDLIKELSNSDKDLRERDNLADIGTFLRTKRGDSYLFDTLLKRAKSTGSQKIIIESLRHPAEVHSLLKKKGILIVVTANDEIRYKRAFERNSENVGTMDDFKSKEKKEMYSDNPHGVALGAVIDLARHRIENNYNDLRELYDDVELFAKEIGLQKATG